MTPKQHSELYVDGLLDVSFARGVVRVDLYSLSATEKHANGQPKPDFRQRIVMSSTNFVEFVGGLQQAVQSLREKGALPPVQSLSPVANPPAEPAAPPPAPVAPAVSEPPRSPNFRAPTTESE